MYLLDKYVLYNDVTKYQVLYYLDLLSISGLGMANYNNVAMDLVIPDTDKKIVKDFKVYKQHEVNAKFFLDSIPKKFNPVFVHIRTSRIFNEYKKFKIFGYLGVHLPINYYKSCIQWFLKNISNPYFIFISDDVPYIKNKFSYLENKIFSTNSIFVDLMIISRCSYGVMSNSSVSWWGGYFNKKKIKIFAPKYWLGWKRKITLQHNGEPKYATLIDPNIFKNKHKNNSIY